MFFKKIGRGRPNFHKIDGCGSFMFKGSVGYSLNGNVVRINKLKRSYRFKLTRQYGKVKNIHIKRDNNGYLWLIVTCDIAPKQYERLGDASIGLDFGLKCFITTSNGEKISHPQTHKKSLNDLRKLSANLSHKAKGSNGRKKAKKRLARLHQRITDQRSDFQWKLAHKLCCENSYIAIEDLNLRGMKKLWGRKVSDLAYADFVNKLIYVASKYGTKVVKIGRFEASSQLCSNCGFKNTATKSLSLRSWVCPHCGAVHDRDINAAINILKISEGKGISLGGSNSKTDVFDTQDAVVLIAEESHVF